jgi:hypothetical protein
VISRKRGDTSPRIPDIDGCMKVHAPDVVPPWRELQVSSPVLDATQRRCGCFHKEKIILIILNLNMPYLLNEIVYSSKRNCALRLTDNSDK